LQDRIDGARHQHGPKGTRLASSRLPGSRQPLFFGGGGKKIGHSSLASVQGWLLRPNRQRSDVASALESKTPFRVAIVEDDLAARNMLVSTLQADADYTVVAEFVEGRTAVSAIPDLAPDMVLVDLGLPDISGIDVIRQLKNTYPEC